MPDFQWHTQVSQQGVEVAPMIKQHKQTEKNMCSAERKSYALRHNK